MNEWVKLHEKDSVVIALRAFAKGEQLTLEGGQSLELLDDVPFGHKIALQSIAAGEHVLKFGYSIGVASAAIEPGAWGHTHNMGTGVKGILSYEYEPNLAALEQAAAMQTQSQDPARTVMGDVREHGKDEIENERAS